MMSYKGVERVKKVRLQTLRHQYDLLQMESFETIATYIGQVLALTNQVKIYGQKCTNQAKVKKILRLSNPRFEHVVVPIEEAYNLSLMTIEEVFNTLQVYKQNMNEK